MLINFTVQNWMSFQNEARFSMVASKEKQHNERVPAIKKYSAKVLPVAVIYGGNASGKTNLFKAFAFIKSLVVGGARPVPRIPAEHFLLDPKSVSVPAKFSIEFLSDEKIYGFSIAVTRTKVVEERLVEITSTSDKILYERHGDKIDFEKKFAEDKYLQYVFKGTRDNQLFLSNSVSQKVDYFKSVYDWFENNLRLVSHDSRFGRCDHSFASGTPDFNAMGETLERMDFGITDMQLEAVLVNDLDVPREQLSDIDANLAEGDFSLLTVSKDPIVFSRRNGQLIAMRLTTFHSSNVGDKILFGMENESDGFKSVIDFLPIIRDLVGQTNECTTLIDIHFFLAPFSIFLLR